MSSRFSSRLAAAVLAASLAAAAPAAANHGPVRAGDDPCNGSDAFGFENFVSRDLLEGVLGQNPGSLRADGTIDRTKVRHAHLVLSGHLMAQLAAKPGHPIERATIEVNAADAYWSQDSTNHQGYVQAAEAREDPARDADSDGVVGGRFTFAPASDIFPDGNMVARVRAYDPDGNELGRLCIDVTLVNGLDMQGAVRANSEPDFEPPAVPTVAPYPQAIAWFPAGEPSDAQRAGYAPKTLRLEFTNPLHAIVVERRERDKRGRKRWVDRSSRLSRDDFLRTHSITGRSFDGGPFEGIPLLTNERVLGPGYRFPFAGLKRERLPSERLRVRTRDRAGRRFCAVYAFGRGANGSFTISPPRPC